MSCLQLLTSPFHYAREETDLSSLDPQEIHESISKIARLKGYKRICDVEVPLREGSKSLEGALDKFDEITFKDGPTIYLKLGDSSDNPGFKIVKADVPKESDAKFEMEFNPVNGRLLDSSRVLGSLPKWIKVGKEEHWLDSTKGIPTGKVITFCMMKKLGITRENLKTIESLSMNALTTLQIVHGIVIKGASPEKAAAASHTAQLNGELALNLGGKIHLSMIWASKVNTPFSSQYKFLLRGEQESEFRKRPELSDIRKKIGLDLLQDCVKTPTSIEFIYTFHPDDI